MREPRWPADIPPPHAALYSLGQRCLDEVNKVARRCPPSTALEHELLEIGRSQALAITKLGHELLRLRSELAATGPVSDGADRRGRRWAAWVASVRRRVGPARRRDRPAANVADTQQLHAMWGSWLLGRTRARRSTRQGLEATPDQSSGAGLLDLARALVVHRRNGSTSWLQRKLHTSYEQALHLMHRLEEEGLVSSPDQLGHRTV